MKNDHSHAEKSINNNKSRNLNEDTLLNLMAKPLLSWRAELVCITAW